MNSEAKKRSELKEIFGKNKIIRESDFASLIDATPNMADDGLHKSSGAPLAIGAGHEDEKKAISIYREWGDDNPLWSVMLASKVTDDQSETLHNGFSITDNNQNSRLFIAESQKNIGINTSIPEHPLHVVGRVKSDGLTIDNVLETPDPRIFGDTLKIRSDGGETQFGGDIKAENNVEIVGDIKVGGKITQDVWHDAELLNGWENYTGNVSTDTTAYNYAGYFKDPIGFIHLRGLVRSGIGAVMRLPEGYRPAYRQLHVAITSGYEEKNGRVDISADGYVYMHRGRNGWLSLDGISFYAAD